MALAMGCSRDTNQIALRVANELERDHGPLVTEVSFTPADMVDVGEIRLNFRDGAVRSDGVAVVCDVVAPRFRAAGLDDDIAVVAYASDGRTLAIGNVDCPDWPVR